MSPAFVLVHGGAATGRWWDLVAERLPGTVVAIDLPGRRGKPSDPMALTVDDCVRSIVDDVRAATTAGETLVVAAHSSGGLFVPGTVVSLGTERVAAIVLYAASVPTEGGVGLECMKPRHRAGIEEMMRAARAEGRQLVTPLAEPETLRTSSGETLDDEQLAFIVDPERLVPDSMNFYFQPVHWSTVASVPVTYVVSGRDRAVPEVLQREMAGRLPNPTTVVEVDAGHYAAVTRPDVLAEIIAGAAPVREGDR